MTADRVDLFTRLAERAVRSRADARLRTLDPLTGLGVEVAAPDAAEAAAEVEVEALAAADGPPTPPDEPDRLSPADPVPLLPEHVHPTPSSPPVEPIRAQVVGQLVETPSTVERSEEPEERDRTHRDAAPTPESMPVLVESTPAEPPHPLVVAPALVAPPTPLAGSPIRPAAMAARSGSAMPPPAEITIGRVEISCAHRPSRRAPGPSRARERGTRRRVARRLPASPRG